MEDFAGDYDTLRHGAGAIPAGRDVLRVAGPDALEYLQGQCSQDLSGLGHGEPADALVLSPQGKLEALVRVTRLDDEELIVDVEGGYGDALEARLERFKLRVKASIERTRWRCISLRGPHAAAAVAACESPTDASLALDFEWNGVLGVDLFGLDPQLPSGVRRAGAAAWESVRVEAGIPAMGEELDERTIAAEAGLLERCVSTTKGCYTGQELVARLEARGNRVARKLRGLVLQGDGDGDPSTSVGHTIGKGSAVQAGGKQIGSVTSVAWSPALEALCAMAYVHRDFEPPCRVEVSARSEADGAEVRVGAEVRELPLA
ncbi:MAG TPA: glycine cleavage T C-terminal barrel domain-containing protein [Acidimicrobiales bacterium]|nr:glycine cleavage T C-terminal barrel domain-containing protein [Acidimicrobiales bacterium]